MMALGQAIIGQPRYLLADELSFGLAPIVVARLVPVIVQLAEKGIGVLQFTGIALRLAAHVYVMQRGRIHFSGSPEALRVNPEILSSAYLAPSGGLKTAGADRLQ
jgi:branched-chain amino acid transport system ATP-binding protein